MSDRRRIIITVLSVSIGSFLSYLLFKFRRGGQDLNQQDLLSLGTILFVSVALILGVGFAFIWKKNDKLK